MYQPPPEEKNGYYALLGIFAGSNSDTHKAGLEIVAQAKQLDMWLAELGKPTRYPYPWVAAEYEARIRLALALYRIMLNSRVKFTAVIRLCLITLKIQRYSLYKERLVCRGIEYNTKIID